MITNAVLVKHGVDRYPARFKFAAFATQGLLNHVVAERMNDRAEFVLTHSKLFDNGLPINKIEFRVMSTAPCARGSAPTKRAFACELSASYLRMGFWDWFRSVHSWRE